VNDARAELVTCLMISQDVCCLSDAVPELARYATRRLLRPLMPSYDDPILHRL
jgi:hypothetical protein